MVLWMEAFMGTHRVPGGPRDWPGEGCGWTQGCGSGPPKATRRETCTGRCGEESVTQTFQNKNAGDYSHREGVKGKVSSKVLDQVTQENSAVGKNVASGE